MNEKPMSELEKLKSEMVERSKINKIESKEIERPIIKLPEEYKPTCVLEEDYIKLQMRARPFLSGYYDFQKLRIQTGLRLVASFYSKLGLNAGKKKTELGLKEIKFLNILVMEFNKITDGIINEKQWGDLLKVRESKIISNTSELALVRSYLDLVKIEAQLFKDMIPVLKEFPEYEYLSGFYGVGPRLIGLMLTHLNRWKAATISQYQAYFGMDVVISEDGTGEGRSSKKHHMVLREYIDKNGEIKIKESLSHNRELKSKLLITIGMNSTQNRDSKNFNMELNIAYRNAYHRYSNRPDLNRGVTPKEKNNDKAHIINMAKRIPAKLLLKLLWLKQGEMFNLPLTPSYEESILGIKHHEGYENRKI